MADLAEKLNAAQAELGQARSRRRDLAFSIGQHKARIVDCQNAPTSSEAGIAIAACEAKIRSHETEIAAIDAKAHRSNATSLVCLRSKRIWKSAPSQEHARRVAAPRSKLSSRPVLER